MTEYTIQVQTYNTDFCFIQKIKKNKFASKIFQSHVPCNYLKINLLR